MNSNNWFTRWLRRENEPRAWRQLSLIGAFVLVGTIFVSLLRSEMPLQISEIADLFCNRGIPSRTFSSNRSIERAQFST